MKKSVGLFLLVTSVVLASCTPTAQKSKDINSKDQTEQTVKKVKETATEVVTTETKETESEEKTTLWNADKDKKLNEFMAQWSQTMGQHYIQYGPNNNADLYGVKLPDAVLNNDSVWQAAVGKAPIVINWSETGEVQNGYALVAVYSDAASQDYLSKHVYFFTINSGVPKVLITMQNQGNPDNYLYFSETENKELKDGFNKIVGSNVSFDEVDSNFTREEQLSYFVSNYELLPYAGYLGITNNGSVRGITYYIEEPIENDKGAILDAIGQVKRISSAVQQKVGGGIPIYLKEVSGTENLVTIKDGEATQANQLFGRVIQGME